MTAKPEDWRTLVPELGKWATVRVLGYGRLEVCLLDGNTSVCRELRLTPDEWDDIEGVAQGGDTEFAASLVRLAWDRAKDDERYLNYDFEYGIEPSSAPIRLPQRSLRHRRERR